MLEEILRMDSTIVAFSLQLSVVLSACMYVSAGDFIYGANITDTRVIVSCLEFVLFSIRPSNKHQAV